MKSNDNADCQACGEGINRRSFFVKSLVCPATGLSLIAFPELLREIRAAGQEKSREEMFGELDAKVAKLYPIYHSCSQPTLAALNDQFGLNADSTVNAIRLFAGGIAGKGETCGAVTGSLLAIGFYFDVVNKSKGGKPGLSMEHGSTFFDRFVGEFGSIRCREVMKHQYGQYIDYGKPEDLKILGKPENQGKCVDVMKRAVRIAAGIILDNA